MKIYKRLMLLLGIPLLLVGCGIDSSSVGDSTSLTSEMPTSQSQVTTYWDVDFDINKDISVNIDSQTIIHNGKATNPSYTYTQNDDTFLGWYKDRYSLEKWNFNSDKVTADRTYMVDGKVSLTVMFQIHLFQMMNMIIMIQTFPKNIHCFLRFEL